MAIVLCLDEVMRPKRFTVSELAREVGLTRANVSNLKMGHARAIRFSTLDAICEVLDCQPGDILKYEPGPRESIRLLDGSEVWMNDSGEYVTEGDGPAAQLPSTDSSEIAAAAVSAAGLRNAKERIFGARK